MSIQMNRKYWVLRAIFSLLALSQSCQSLLGIRLFGQIFIRILPDLEEFIVLFDGFSQPAFLLIQFGHTIMILGMDEQALLTAKI